VSGSENAHSREKYRESLSCNNLYRKGLLFSGAFQIRRGFAQVTRGPLRIDIELVFGQTSSQSLLPSNFSGPEHNILLFQDKLRKWQTLSLCGISLPTQGKSSHP
jgi:hypothetical protein